MCLNIKSILNNRIVRILVISIAFIQLVNCDIAFREGMIKRKSSGNTETINKSIFYSTSLSYYLDRDELPFLAKIDRKAWTKEIDKKLSKAFAYIKTDSKDVDYVIELEITKQQKTKYKRIIGVLNALTLRMIPDSADFHFLLKATFKDKNNNILGVIEKEEKYVLWDQTFFFLLFHKHPVFVE